MKIEVKLFAAARQAVDQELVEIETGRWSKPSQTLKTNW